MLPGPKRIHTLPSVLTHLKCSDNYVYRCVLCPRRVFMVFRMISQQAVIISINNNNINLVRTVLFTR